ncbi:MAG: hypothetical protein KGL39_37260, partial [Patescibacteria group bacterium]|nr:hypothetical protein [Patescibacteria group bacterium]
SMTVTAAYPTGSNTYVPEVTDKLVVDFSQNVDRFPVNRYVQIVPVDKQVGKYTRMTREQAHRILEVNGSDMAWPDGQFRPMHNNETESFGFYNYNTMRVDLGFNVGRLAVEQGAFDVIAHNAGQVAERCMTLRTQRAITAATTTGNYPAANVLTVSSISGNFGKWDVSTTARKDIERSFQVAGETIMQYTLNGVQPQDLIVVMSAGCARKVKLSQEIIDYIKGSPNAYDEIYGDLRGQNPNSYWGLPSRLFGVELVIEPTVKVTSFKGASSTTLSYVLPDATPFMCSRPGGLVSERASETASFSTLTFFMKEEMTVEQFDEPKHRLIEHHVCEDYDVQVTAPIAGVLFQAAVN